MWVARCSYVRRLLPPYVFQKKMNEVYDVADDAELGDDALEAACEASARAADAAAPAHRGGRDAQRDQGEELKSLERRAQREVRARERAHRPALARRHLVDLRHALGHGRGGRLRPDLADRLARDRIVGHGRPDAP